jgi:GT2 family glycosyltransferase
MDLSIVIVSYNTRDLLHRCLSCVPAGASGLLFETFVVDNASPDDSAGMVAAEFPSVRLIANTDNAGFTRANNQALRLACGRHVVILNPDTEPEPGSLTLMVRFLDEHPDAGACGPKLLNSDGSLQTNGRRFPTPWREFLGVSGLRRLDRAGFDRRLEYGRTDFDVTCRVDVVSGACLMVRRDVMERVGMLDERFYMFYEEYEWCWRMRRAGWVVYYVADSRVTHHWMGAVKQRSRAMTAQLYRSQWLYYRKTAGPLAQAVIAGVVTMALAKNEIVHVGVAVKRRLRAMGLVR